MFLSHVSNFGFRLQFPKPRLAGRYAVTRIAWATKSVRDEFLNALWDELQNTDCALLRIKPYSKPQAEGGRLLDSDGDRTALSGVAPLGAPPVCGVLSTGY